jgi:hypothetical protein
MPWQNIIEIQLRFSAKAFGKTIRHLINIIVN